MRRVVVTGMGIVSSIGNNTQEVLASLHDAKSGITRADIERLLGVKIFDQAVYGMDRFPSRDEGSYLDWRPGTVDLRWDRVVTKIVEIDGGSLVAVERRSGREVWRPSSPPVWPASRGSSPRRC